VFYILYGGDSFTRQETVIGLRARLFAADPMAELNYTALDGRKLGVPELKTAAETLPFMGERRLVVVHGLLGRCNPRGGEGQGKALSEALVEWLADLPATTRLVFVDDALHANNPVLKWATRWRGAQPVPDAAAVIREFSPPKPDQLPRWLVGRAAQRGGKLEPAAAVALSEALIRDGVVDLRLADNELEKLLTFAGDRPVAPADVEQLTVAVSLESVFRLIDALAERNGPAASTLLHQFLVAGEPPLRLLALASRQFRLLLQARTLLDGGAPTHDLGGRLAVPPFVARKLIGQSRRFSIAFLESALKRLLDIDAEIKTGRMDGVLALDLFVAGVCGTQPSPLRHPP